MIWLLLLAAATLAEAELSKRIDLRTAAAVVVDLVVHRHRQRVS